MTSSDRTAAGSVQGAGLDRWGGTFEIVVALAAVAAFLVLGDKFIGQSFEDDTYIGFRYAANIAAGHGIVWNPGEPPVEGFTDLLWILLLAAGSVVAKLPVDQVAMDMGLAAGALGVVVAWFAARLALPTPLRHFGSLAGLALALSPIYVRHAVSGLESIFVALVLLLLALVIAATGLARAWRLVLLAAVSFVACLSRPDAIVPCFVATVSASLIEAPTRRGIRQLASFYIVPLALLMLAYLGWKQWYFGSIIPLPAFQKLSPLQLYGRADLVRWVLEDITGFLGYVSPLVTASLIAVLLRPRQQPPLVWAVFAAVAVFELYLLCVIPVMGFQWRFAFPLLGLIAVAAIASVIPLIAAATVAATDRRLAAVAATAVMVLLIASPIAQFHEMRVLGIAKREGVAWARAYGEALSGIDGIKVAWTESGGIPYFSRAPFLDLAGLNDKYIAYHRFDADFEAEYPSYLDSVGLPDVYVRVPCGYPYALMSHQPKLAAAYQSVPAGSHLFYVRRDSPARELIVERLNAVTAHRHDGAEEAACTE